MWGIFFILTGMGLVALTVDDYLSNWSITATGCTLVGLSMTAAGVAELSLRPQEERQYAMMIGLWVIACSMLIYLVFLIIRKNIVASVVGGVITTLCFVIAMRVGPPPDDQNGRL